MGIAPNHLVLRQSSARAKVLATWRDNRWQTADTKKSNFVDVIEAQNDAETSYWWAYVVGRAATLVKPAYQAINYSSSRNWSNAFQSSRLVPQGRPGLAVLCVKTTEGERWLGPVRLGKPDPSTLDVTVLDQIATTVASGTTPLVMGGGAAFIPPDWEPVPLDGSIALHSKDEIAEYLKELLQPTVLERLEEIRNHLPALFARLDLDHLAGISVGEAVAESLAKYPVFARQLEWEASAARSEIGRARAEAEIALDEAKQLAASIVEDARSEREKLASELKDLREKKREEILRALYEVTDDNRSLALLAAVNARSVPPAIDLTEVVQVLKGLASRPEQRIDLAPLAGAISAPTPIDLGPLVSAVRELAAPRSVAVDPPPSHGYLAPWLDGAGTELSDIADLQIEALDPSHQAMLVLSHAGRVPIAYGPEAEDAVGQTLRRVAGPRSLWWSVPSDASDVRRVLADPAVLRLIETATSRPERLFGLVLEGIDRAPTEAFFEPLLSFSAGKFGWPEFVHGWPKNVIIMATATLGGRTTLTPSPGVWRRCVPVLAASQTPSRSTELSPAAWQVRSRSFAELPLDGLLPNAVSPTGLAPVARSLDTFDVAAPAALVHGLAAALCLVRGGKERPLGAVAASFPSLFP